MLHFLQSYKLAFEEKHLKPFRDLFEQFDTTSSGCLNQNQCRILSNELIKVRDVEG